MAEPDSSHTNTLDLPIRILGAGRLGTQLAVAFAAAGQTDVMLWNPRALAPAREASFQSGLDLLDRSAHTPPRLLTAVPLSHLVPAGKALYFLTAPDDALETLALALAQALNQTLNQTLNHALTQELTQALADPPPQPSADASCLAGVAFHCSGARPLSVLDPLRTLGLECAGLHPLQSFSGVPDPKRFQGIFCALEGAGPGLAQADVLARRLGGIPLVLKAGGRVAYHASAVVASNLLVALVDMAVTLLGDATDADAHTRLNVLLPLVEGTVRNLRTVGLPGALTGPVARGDADVISRHLDYLSGGGGPAPLAQVYPLLSSGALSLALAQGLAPQKVEAIAQLLNVREVQVSLNGMGKT